MCFRRTQVCTTSFPCHFIHPLSRLLLDACSGWFVLCAKDTESFKTGPQPRKVHSGRKDIVSKINADATECTQRQVAEEIQRRKQLLYGESWGKEVALWLGPQRQIGVYQSENLSTSIPEAVEYINWKKWDGCVHFNLHANKGLEVQMLSTSRSLWEKWTLSDPKEGINQLLAFPPPYLTALSGASPRLHQQWFK